MQVLAQFSSGTVYAAFPVELTTDGQQIIKIYDTWQFLTDVKSIEWSGSSLRFIGLTEDNSAKLESELMLKELIRESEAA